MVNMQPWPYAGISHVSIVVTLSSIVGKFQVLSAEESHLGAARQVSFEDVDGMEEKEEEVRMNQIQKGLHLSH